MLFKKQMDDCSFLGWKGIYFSITNYLILMQLVEKYFKDFEVNE